MTNSDAVQNADTTEIMPVSMAVIPTPKTSTTATPGIKKDLAYFQREVGNATLAFWRSSKFLADKIIEARMELSPEDFKELIETAQFDYSFVCKLIKQGADFRLNDPANDPILPAAFSSRHEIMLMKESTFRIGVTQKLIHKNCTLDDLKKLRTQFEGKKGKSKKATPKKAAPSSRSAAETPQDASTPAETSNAPESEPEASNRTEAAVKVSSKVAPLQMPKKPVESVGTTAKSRIAVYLAPETAEKNRDQIAALQADLGRLVAKYPFLESFEMADAA